MWGERGRSSTPSPEVRVMIFFYWYMTQCDFTSRWVRWCVTNNQQCPDRTAEDMKRRSRNSRAFSRTHIICVGYCSPTLHPMKWLIKDIILKRNYLFSNSPINETSLSHNCKKKRETTNTNTSVVVNVIIRQNLLRYFHFPKTRSHITDKALNSTAQGYRRFLTTVIFSSSFFFRHFF